MVKRRLSRLPIWSRPVLLGVVVVAVVWGLYVILVSAPRRSETALALAAQPVGTMTFNEFAEEILATEGYGGEWSGQAWTLEGRVEALSDSQLIEGEAGVIGLSLRLHQPLAVSVAPGDLVELTCRLNGAMYNGVRMWFQADLCRDVSVVGRLEQASCSELTEIAHRMYQGPGATAADLTFAQAVKDALEANGCG
jgi:hypothetical protein